MIAQPRLETETPATARLWAAARGSPGTTLARPRAGLTPPPPRHPADRGAAPVASLNSVSSRVCGTEDRAQRSWEPVAPLTRDGGALPAQARAANPGSAHLPPRAPATAPGGHEAVRHPCAGWTGAAGGRGGVSMPVRHWRRAGRRSRRQRVSCHAPLPALRSKGTRRAHNSTRSTGSATLVPLQNLLQRPLRVTEAAPRDQLAPGAAAACRGRWRASVLGVWGTSLTPTGLQGEGVTGRGWPATTRPPPSHPDCCTCPGQSHVHTGPLPSTLSQLAHSAPLSKATTVSLSAEGLACPALSPLTSSPLPVHCTHTASSLLPGGLCAATS